MKKTSTKDICLQTDLLTEKHTRTIHIQTSMSMKTFQQQDLVNTENRKLKQTILNCEAEIFKLKARPEISKKHCHTQTEEFENEVESVEDIFKEMCMPFPMLSPMSTSRENLSLDDMFSPIPADVNDILPVLANVPDIIITPPTPSIEKNIEKFTDFLKTTDIQNNHLIDDKNVSQRKQINITAKDNFKNSLEKIRRKSENTGAVVQGITELLGFFNVKNENVTPSNSRMENILENKPLTLVKSLIPILNNGSEMTSENILETLADLVSQKLKEKDNFSKRKEMTSASDKSDSFYSETETEIERLFEKPNDNVLTRNKNLLKRAKQQKLRKSAFTPSLEDRVSSRKSEVTDNGWPLQRENAPETIPSVTALTCISEETQVCETDIFKQESTSWFENKNGSNTTELPPINENMENSSDCIKYSVCPLETVTKTIKSPSSKLGKLFVCESPEPTKEKGEILENCCNEKTPAASTNFTMYNENTESCDSFQYSVCPELLSPLSSVTSKDSPRGKNSHISLQIEDKRLKENEEMSVEKSPLNSNLEFSNCQNQMDSLNTSQREIDNSVIQSPISSACINKYLSNEEVMSAEICTFLNNFDRNKCLIEDHKEITESPKKLFNSVNVLHNDQSNISLKNESQKKLNISLLNENNFLNKLKNSINIVRAAKQKELQREKYFCAKNLNTVFLKEPTYSGSYNTKNFHEEENTVTQIDTPSKILNNSIDMNTTMEQEINQNVSANKLHPVVSLGNINLSSTENYEIPEHFMGEDDKDAGIFEGNSIKSNLTCLSSPLKCSVEKLSLHKLSEEMEKLENVDNKIGKQTFNHFYLREFMEYEQYDHKTPFTESIFHTRSILTSSPIKTITKEILDVLPDQENTPNVLFQTNEDEDMPSYPQSPVNDHIENIDVKPPKIIPLERLVEQATTHSFDKSVPEDVLVSSELSKSYQKQKFEPFKSEIIPINNNDQRYQHENFTLDIKKISDQGPLGLLPKEENTASILSKINELKNTANYLISPIKENEVLIPPKIMSIETFNEQDVISRSDKITSTGSKLIYSKSQEPNVEVKTEGSKSIIPLNSDGKDYLGNMKLAFMNNEKCQSIEPLKTSTTSNEISPKILRRSKRNCKKVRYSELLLKNCTSRCREYISVNEQFEGNHKTEDTYQIFKVEPEKCYEVSQLSNKSGFLHKNFTLVSELLEPIKKKRDSPISSIEPLQEKELPKDKSIDLDELLQDQDSIAGICKKPAEENLNSSISLDENNFELKSDTLILETTSNVSEESRITNLWEPHELHNAVLTDKTDSKEIMDINNETKEKWVDETAVVRNMKNISELESKGETQELLNDMLIDETDSKEINEVNSKTKGKQTSEKPVIKKNKIIRKFKSTHTVFLEKISDIVAQEKKAINLWEPDDLLVGETNSKEMSDKNNDVKEKLPYQKVVKKRKNISKLKSNVLRQFRVKRKMLQMDVEIGNRANVCDLDLKINNNSSRSNADVKKTNVQVGSNNKSNTNEENNIPESSNMNNNENKCKDKKIHIVQNILIPANSCYAVDLLNKNAGSELLSNCDIKLNASQTSSQSDVNISKLPLQKKKIEISTKDNNIPVKKKRLVPTKLKKVTNENDDILSKIMQEMDKERPNNISKSVTPPCIPKEIIGTSIEDKEWRKGIIVIAESINNVTTEENAKVRILMSRLLKLSTEEQIPDEIVVEFKRQNVDNIAEVSQDIYDKPDDKYYPAPLMTKTQRILLTLMVRLERENVEDLLDRFLSKAETFLFKIGCGIRPMIPVTRLYMAVCRLRANIDRMRKFCCDAFYFMSDLAVPLLFTVLTSWTEVLPKEADLKNYPLAKVLVQVVHLKSCNKPGYNLLPLRFLLHQFHGYPNERWNCDEIFDELFQQYLRNPVKSSDLAIRLLCKNKNTKWIYQKINEFFKPLIYKIPATNVNFKATAIILIGNISRQFKPKNEFDESCLKELHRWLIGLTEEEGVSELVKRSVYLSLTRLPRKKCLAPKDVKNNSNCKKIVSRIKNKKSKKRKK
ncbi:hypothetical protein NQ314_001298 [Rhamnusium bicolor]|uniref:Uncharacterized protein n=1 Tax=Rhamnusium bicolor TaxID=1586634 RepID=A0AAV8ZSL1_9CUCU|nr:hypothetical protein NQ314_001298 [Rhamnusium bicolor]